MRKLLLILFLLVLGSSVYSQSLSDVEELYENFEFEKVIQVSQKLLKTEINNENRVKLLMLKGASEYSLGDVRNARTSFIDLLKIDSSYKINPLYYSPKIVELFNEVRSNYKSIRNAASDIPEKKQEPKVDIKTEYKLVDNSKSITEAALKNIFIPGWGQLTAGNKSKGYIMGGGSIALLGSMIYSIVNTNSKYNDYITETNVNLIEGKYQSYNNSYKVRNLLIFSYAALWVYSQLDLYLFTEFNLPQMNVSSNTQSKNQDVSFNFSIPLN